MESLGKDVLTLIALEMVYPDILKFCSSSSKINKAVCKNENFWRNKLYKTYPRLKHWRFSNYKKAYSDTEKIMGKINSQVADANNVFGFLRPIYIKEELIDFLSYANFGTYPETEIPLNFLFFPLLDLKIISLSFLNQLFQIYGEVNNLQFSENGKKYYKAGSDMEKYLGKYLDTLEEGGRGKMAVYDAKGNLKPSFNRNKFVFNQRGSIYSQGFISISSLSESQKEYLLSLEVKSLISKIDQVFNEQIYKIKNDFLRIAGLLN